MKRGTDKWSSLNCLIFPFHNLGQLRRGYNLIQRGEDVTGEFKFHLPAFIQKNYALATLQSEGADVKMNATLTIITTVVRA